MRVSPQGMCLTERQSHSKVDGRLIGAGTWDYKPPCALDIPLQFNIDFSQTPNKAPGACEKSASLLSFPVFVPSLSW